MFYGKSSDVSSDLNLIERFRSGNDMESLGVLFTRYSIVVYGVCLKYLKDRDEAKDAVMQIFEKLQSSLKTHDIDYFKGWLYSTTKNHCLMYLRSQKKIFKEEIDEGVMENEFMLHPAYDDNTYEKDLNKLEKCIERLKDEQKECVHLFYLKEMCYKEIVDTIGMDLKKVKSHIQNGKRNLKICMESSE